MVESDGAQRVVQPEQHEGEPSGGFGFRDQLDLTLVAVAFDGGGPSFGDPPPPPFAAPPPDLSAGMGGAPPPHNAYGAPPPHNAYGAPPGGEALAREFAVHHAGVAGPHPLGLLRIAVGLDAVHARLAEKAVMTLAAMTTGTLLIALMIHALVGRWVTRHLQHNARHPRSLSLEQLG